MDLGHKSPVDYCIFSFAVFILDKSMKFAHLPNVQPNAYEFLDDNEGMRKDYTMQWTWGVPISECCDYNWTGKMDVS